MTSELATADTGRRIRMKRVAEGTDEEIPYDPAGANALLDKAGYAGTDGDGIREDPANGEPLHLLMPASSDTTGAVESGELIVGYLKKIGISVDLKPSSDANQPSYA